jgi:3-methylcrotonyl-CoA carboxylase alpha subunit
MMGQIIAVDIKPGQTVAAGDRLGLMESMKMELVLRAPKAGAISSVFCKQGDTVERNQCIFLIDAEKETAA